MGMIGSYDGSKELCTPPGDRSLAEASVASSAKHAQLTKQFASVTPYVRDATRINCVDGVIAGSVWGRTASPTN
jgi:hypothetical protein